jgi:hypothetical protein
MQCNGNLKATKVALDAITDLSPENMDLLMQK